MKRTSLVAMLAGVLASCSPFHVDQGVISEIESATAQKGSQPDSVRAALLPPLRAEMPKVPGAPAEPRFDLVVNSAPARQVFMSIVSGTRYSMIVNPAVGGTLSLNLKDVTVREALEAIREVYGYEFRVDGTRIYVESAGLQTRVFQVNYLIGLRSGRSDVRVSSGAISGSQPGGAGAPVAVTAGTPGQGTPALGAFGLSSIATASLDASRVSMVSQNDLWSEVTSALRSLVGTAPGRNVVVSPQSGVIVVRAMPEELRNVERYLKAMRLSVERQVMIEAKVVDVTLNNAYQAGINWAAFPSSHRVMAGVFGSNTTLGTTGNLITGNPPAINVNVDPTGRTLGTGILGSGLAGTAVSAAGAVGAGVFGLAIQTNNFAALLQFLESQGNVQVLSSPRVAALNNQKAVLKVGTDQFFVTNVTGTPVQSATGAPVSIQLTPTLNSFFSGVSLDITPQINEDGNILLHIHPLVSNVVQQDLIFNFGGGGTDTTLPLAKSSVNETDTIVRVQDGNIVALGGLMKVDVANDRSGIPVLQDIPGVGGLFGNTTRTRIKRELVILLKPTVIKGEKDWEEGIDQAHERMQNFGSGARLSPFERP